MSLLSGVEQRNTEFFNSTMARILGLPDPGMRMIDRLEYKTRTNPMKVLCLGMSRTGTLSLHAALERLEYRPYHMAEVVKNMPVAGAVWGELLEWKLNGVGKAPTRSDFDKVFGDSDCVEDVPMILFAEELIKFYPDAKVILTNRPVNDWLRSMRVTVLPTVSWRTWDWVSWADPDFAAPWWAFASKWFEPMFGDFRDESGDSSPDPVATHPDSPAARYLQHYRRVRAACPPERLLEFNFGDGYDKLCPFLGVETVEEAYPRVNDGPFFVKFHEAILHRAAWAATQKVAAVAIPTIAVVGALAVYGRRWALSK